MDFSLSIEQREWDERIKNFCENDLRKLKNTDIFFTKQQWQALGSFGLLGLSIPKKFGGQGLDAVTTAIAMQSFGKYCDDMGLVFSAAAHLFACSMPILEFGSDNARETILPKLASGEWIGCNAITESEAGSDIGAIKTKAKLTKDRFYQVTGLKTFAANAPIADIFVTYASTSPSLKAFGLSGFILNKVEKKIIPSLPLNKIGLRSCPSGGVEFNDVLVHESYLLGVEGQGRYIFQQSMRWERACLFAAYLGMMERLLLQTIAYSKKREQFGKPISRNQAVSHRIVDMKLRLEAARLLLYRACWGIDQNDLAMINVSMSKIAISEAALALSLDMYRIYGGVGYLKENNICKMIEDALGAIIFSGTNDIQKEIIAGEMGL